MPPNILKDAEYKVLRVVVTRISCWGTSASGCALAFIDLDEPELQNSDFNQLQFIIIHEYIHEWATGQCKNPSLTI
jgi:hypothetical protein